MMRIAIFLGLVVFASAQNYKCSDVIPRPGVTLTQPLDKVFDLNKGKILAREKCSSADKASKEIIAKFIKDVQNHVNTASETFDSLYRAYYKQLINQAGKNAGKEKCVKDKEHRLSDASDQASDAFRKDIRDGVTDYIKLEDSVTYVDLIDSWFQLYKDAILACIELYDRTEMKDRTKKCTEFLLTEIQKFCQIMVEERTCGDTSILRAWLDGYFKATTNFKSIFKSECKLDTELRFISGKIVKECGIAGPTKSVTNGKACDARPSKRG